MNHPEATTSTAGRGGRRRGAEASSGAAPSRCRKGQALAAAPSLPLGLRQGAGQSRLTSHRLASPRPLRALPGGCAMHPVFQSSRRDFTFGPWRLSAARTHIMKSAQAER